MGGFFVGIVLMKRKRKTFLPCSHDANKSNILSHLETSGTARNSLIMDDFNVETEASDSLTSYG